MLLASVYGTEDGTSWVLDLVAEQLPAWGRLDASTRDFLRVAERLVELPAVDRVRTDILVGRVVMAGFKRVKRIRDLDAAEAFPEALLPDAAPALLHERTRDVVEAVLDYLTYHVDDPETLATEARSLRDRARSHGIDVDIADLLDKADDLAHKEYEDGDSV